MTRTGTGGTLGQLFQVAYGKNENIHMSNGKHCPSVPASLQAMNIKMENILHKTKRRTCNGVGIPP